MKRMLGLFFLCACAVCGYAKPRATVLTYVEWLPLPSTERRLQFNFYLRNDSDETIRVVTNQRLWRDPAIDWGRNLIWQLRVGFGDVFGVKSVPSESELNIVRLRKGEYCRLKVAATYFLDDEPVEIDCETQYIVEKEIIERFGVDDLEITYLYDKKVHRVIGDSTGAVSSDAIKAFFRIADP